MVQINTGGVTQISMNDPINKVVNLSGLNIVENVLKIIRTQLNQIYEPYADILMHNSCKLSVIFSCFLS